MDVLIACLSVYYMDVVRRGHLFPWTRVVSYMWVLRIEPRSSAGTASIQNHIAIYLSSPQAAGFLFSIFIILFIYIPVVASLQSPPSTVPHPIRPPPYLREGTLQPQ